LALLYSDENFPYPTVEELRRLGHDVLTAQEVGQANLGIRDDAVLAFAHSLARIVLTQNRKHFRNLHKGGQAHSGIIICTLDSNFTALATRIHTELNCAFATSGSLVGQLISVVRPLR
jgi:predicted nuclease of predicted toxin-antitoxin system